MPKVKIQTLKKTRTKGLIYLYLFHFVILSQQSIRTVGDAHGDDAHSAYHHHGNIHIREDCHHSSS